jgi:ferrochelatase
VSENNRAEGLTGVLVMAYGTATGPEDVEAYYTHIRHGRPPEPEALKELQERYEMIGGSPLLGITEAQADGIAGALEAAHPGRFTVAMGQKHSSPFIEDAVAELLGRGVERIIGIVLAPHFSTMSIAQYRSRAEEAASEAGVSVTVIESWHEEPGYLEFLNRAITDAYAELPEDRRGSVELAVTAHSLPVAILDRGDIYVEELEKTRDNLSGRPEFTGTMLAWQSAGRTEAEWIGPDICDVMPDLAARGRTAVVVCAAGFVSDHLEVKFDIDHEAQQAAAEAGLALTRTAMPNDDPGFCATLAGIVAREAGRA